MSLKIGDSVRVKDAVMCPDDNSLYIGGWQGRVFEIEDVVGIRWDSITLQQLPHEYIKRSEEEGLGWTEMFLSVDEIELVDPRDSNETAETIREEMEAVLYWLGEGKEGERILKVIVHTDDPIEAWNQHLTQTLKFPFDAKVSEPQDKGPLDYGDKMRVHGIAEADDHYGILVDVTCGGQHFLFPLCDLTVQDRKSPNYTPVKDYCIWFANS
jgi:hypothetical protein